MDNKYSFDSLNYSGITDVPVLTIQSSKLEIRNFNTLNPVQIGQNIVSPLVRDNGNVVFRDIYNNLVYEDQLGSTPSTWQIQIGATNRELLSEGSPRRWYYMDNGTKVYIKNDYGEYVYALTNLSKHKITNVDFTLTDTSGHTIFEERGELAIQGNSSAEYPSVVKKSFKIELDNKIAIGAWGQTNDFSIKAYFSEWTNVRDITGQKIFEQMLIMNGVRPNGNSTSNTSVLCHTDGFPVWVKFIDKTNTVFDWGLYVFQTRKKRSTFGMTKDNISQIAFEGLGEVSRRELINPDHLIISTQDEQNLLEELSKFDEVFYSLTDAEQEALVLSYINVPNFLDVFLLFLLLHDTDVYGHNTVYATWDAVLPKGTNPYKYFTIPYDLDLSFGQPTNVEGSNVSFLLPESSTLVSGIRGLGYSFIGRTTNVFPNYAIYRAMAVTRYAALRNEGIFSAANIVELAKKLYFQTTGLANAKALYNSQPEKLGMTGGPVTEEGKPADTLYDDPQFQDNYYRDKLRWGWYNVRTSSTNVKTCSGVCNPVDGRENIFRIQQWITDRLNYLDTIFEYGSTPSHNTRNLKYNNLPVEIVNYNNKSIQSVIYNTIEVYGNN